MQAGNWFYVSVSQVTNGHNSFISKLWKSVKKTKTKHRLQLLDNAGVSCRHVVSSHVWKVSHFRFLKLALDSLQGELDSVSVVRPEGWRFYSSCLMFVRYVVLTQCSSEQKHPWWHWQGHCGTPASSSLHNSADETKCLIAQLVSVQDPKYLTRKTHFCKCHLSPISTLILRAQNRSRTFYDVFRQQLSFGLCVNGCNLMRTLWYFQMKVDLYGVVTQFINLILTISSAISKWSLFFIELYGVTTVFCVQMCLCRHLPKITDKNAAAGDSNFITTNRCLHRQ